MKVYLMYTKQSRGRKEMPQIQRINRPAKERGILVESAPTTWLDELVCAKKNKEPLKYG